MSQLAGDYVQVLVDGYELTGDSNRITINDGRDMYDVSSFASQAHRFLPGKQKISLDHTGYMNSDQASSHPALKAVDIEGIVSILLGENASPTAGDQAYSLSVRQGQYTTRPAVGNVVSFSANFSNDGLRDGWGVILTPPISISDTEEIMPGANNGSPTTSGGTVYLHILSVSGSQTYTITVEGSTTSNFATPVLLGTFSADGLTIGSERLALNGTIHQYVRIKATIDGGGANTIRLAANLVRF